MALDIISLTDILRSGREEEDIKELLFSFSSLKIQHNPGADDVEHFLHRKAIQFEKMDLSRTYLVMSTFQKKPFIAGYFSISNRPLIIPRKYFQRLPTTVRKRLMGVGHKTQQSSYEIKGFLLGQLGRNYSDTAKKAKCIAGNELLQLAYAKVQEAHRIVGGRIIYLECEDHEKIKEFYFHNGFRELEEYRSENDLCLMVKKIDHL
jgi:hypothetical protein